MNNSVKRPGSLCQLMAIGLFSLVANNGASAASDQYGIFHTRDGGNTWQTFDGEIATEHGACDDPQAIPLTASDSALPLQTRLFVANPSSNDSQQTFLRFINVNDSTTAVEVYGIDDAGNVSANGAVSFTLAAGAAKQITAQDLENGNTAKDIAGNFCNGQGKWQLLIRSDNPIDVMGLIRTPDGFLTSLTDAVPREGDASQIYFANPASNSDQQTFIRIVNITDQTDSVTVTGIDDTGTVSTGVVTFSLGPYESKQITVQDLENGNTGKGLAGTLDDGTGKWRLTVTSPLSLQVMSLIRTPTGFLTNLSGMVEPNAAGDHEVLFANPASETTHTTFLRVINTSDSTGSVNISGVDDNGNTAPGGQIMFDLVAGEAKQLNASDLEDGNQNKGLSGGLGDGAGRWRLTISSSALSLQVMSLIRTPDGFLTNLSRTAPVRSDGTNDIYLFNPGSNTGQRSSMRIVNLGSGQASITISGTDDNGNVAPGGDVTLNLDAGAATDITAQDLESGSAAFSGALGDGAGKWHLEVSGNQDIRVLSLLDTDTGFLTNLSRVAEDSQNAAAFFRTNISGPVIQSVCINCHVEGGAAASSALQYTPAGNEGYQDSNFQLLQSYVADNPDGANNLLEKPRGVNHGGGVQLATESDEYQSLVQFLELLNADIDEANNVGSGDFWEGVVLASPAQTLRRAALIVAHRLPTDAELAAVESGSDAVLRDTIRGLMEGDGFHNFLTSGANDRLFTDAFLESLFFEASDLNGSVFFPEGANRYYNDQPETDAEEQEKFHWVRRWTWGLARAPLELIAYIVMNDRSYQEVVTADYMMVNYLSADILNSDVTFEVEDHRVFLPGQNQGQILRDDQLIAVYEPGLGVNIFSHGDFIDYPQAGVLNTHAFLSRYPTTETNRNRARARWTYYHFLGVDIEKSAQRTTDPEALADTDNPTMNNPACTVCHSLHDPVAGTFQNYGNEGFYRDKEGGLDSLPATYKYPRHFDETSEESEYLEGDTWFRDMRTPGFEGQIAPSPENSLAWLGSVIAEDPRFATAAIKFWWPALIGNEALTPPEANEDDDFQQRLLAFEAQNTLMEDLGTQFAQGVNGGNPYNGKDLMTEIIMSPWFRATALSAAVSTTTAATTQYGTHRLLTPRELEQKSRELLGWTWGAGQTEYQFDGVWTNLVDRFRIYYGGIDSDGIRERSRALTALMANVAERQAVTMACPAVMLDFDRNEADRLLFGGIDPDMTPTLEFRQTYDVLPDKLTEAETYTLSGSLSPSTKTIRISFLNDYNEEADRNLRLDRLTVVDPSGAEVLTVELEDFNDIEGANAECGTGTANDYNLWGNCSLTVPFVAEVSGTHEIRVRAFGNQAGPDAPIMAIQLDSNDPESGTSAGATAIKTKLTDLHRTLLGETPNATELEETYQLLVATWLDRLSQEDRSWAWSWPEENCFFYLDEHWAEGGISSRGQDPTGMLNTWTSVLIYLMTDFHYLHE